MWYQQLKQQQELQAKTEQIEIEIEHNAILDNTGLQSPDQSRDNISNSGNDVNNVASSSRNSTNTDSNTT